MSVDEHMQGHELIPSARRLINSLRDLGYDFAQAVADIVDNSIEARASVIAIDVEFDGDNSWVRIADNGKGMKPDVLREAMRYGAERHYDVNDLGKFGLGLKTASMSQCQRLSVASRWNRGRADIAAYAWDLEHIERTNRWEILAIDRNGLGPAIRQPLNGTTGTVVLWERLDRILGYKHPYGENARKRLLTMCRDLEEHLAMVFHRFLAGEVRNRKLKILVNGNQVRPWDPYARDEKYTQRLSPVTLQAEYEGQILGEVLVEPYVLPHQTKFSSAEAHGRASGPQKWNRQQGFYIYRADRMIQSGGWSGLRTLDEHAKLARVAISFPPKLDEAFKVNVAKMRVQIPSRIRDALEKSIGPVLRIAQNTYRKANSAGGHPDRSQPNGARTRGQSSNAGPDKHDTGARMWTFDEFARTFERAATPREKPIIRAVINRVRSEVTAKR